MTVRKITFKGEGVSWTDKPMDYFIHRIDRTKMLEFFEKAKERVCYGSGFDLCLRCEQYGLEF